MNFVEACKEIEANGGIFENEIGTKLSTEGDGYVGISFKGPPGRTSNKIFSSKTIVNNCQGEFQRVVDWSKVAVDTKVLVRLSESSTWIPRYFAEYKHNMCCTWTNGCTKWSADGRQAGWSYYKLAEEGE